MGDEPGIEGRRVLAEGREAVVHEWVDGTVLRLMRSSEGAEAMARAGAASEAARRAGVPTPRVHETVEVDGRPGQVVARVDGPDLFAHLAANPLRLWRGADLLAEVQADLHGVTAPTSLPSTHERLRARLDGSDLVPPPAARRALDLLADLPEGTALCHGDLHPGNLLVTPEGPMLIDWSNATRGDPLADVARTQVMLQIGALPPSAPAVVRGLARGGRAVLVARWARGYARRRPVDRTALARWRVVAATARLAEDIEAERAALLAIADAGAAGA
ncbi:MAG: phosphotransferase [Acidimicrobiales bacterium]|nr:phosphotransferase [Acidimicrobiales bacterium]